MREKNDIYFRQGNVQLIKTDRGAAANVDQ
jgi:hypothetical protein